MTKKIVPIEIYKRGICFMCGAKEDMLKDLAESGDYGIASSVADTDWGDTEAITCSDGRDVWVFSVKPMTLPCLCHELTHVVFRIFQIVGAEPQNDLEAYAYLYEYLFREITSASAGFPLQWSSDGSQHTSD